MKIVEKDNQEVVSTTSGSSLKDVFNIFKELNNKPPIAMHVIAKYTDHTDTIICNKNGITSINREDHGEDGSHSLEYTIPYTSLANEIFTHCFVNNDGNDIVGSIDIDMGDNKIFTLDVSDEIKNK